MKFLTSLTLAKKITLLTTIGLIVGISIFGFLGIRSVNKATEAMLDDRMTTTHILADYLDEVLETAFKEFQYTIQLIERSGLIDDLGYMMAMIDDTFNRLSVNTHSIYLLDEDYRIIGTNIYSPEILGYDISHYYTPNQNNEEDSIISNLVSNPLDNTPVILFTNPIQLSNEQGIGSVVVATNFIESKIGGFIQTLKMGQTGYVEIVDQNGIVIARTEPGPELAPFERSDHSGRFAALISSGEATRGLCHTCHEPVQKVEEKDLLAFVPISLANWGIIIRQSENEALAPINELRRNLVIYGLILAFIVLLFVIITTRDIVGRIKILTGAAQKIAAGDLNSPVTMTQKDDVGVLAQSLEDMRNKLKISYGELERLNKEIQHKDNMRGEVLQDMFSIQEEERKRIARELHDETSQVLASLDANLEAAINILPENGNKIEKILRRAQVSSIKILDEVNRMIYELRPSLLDDLGLIAAVNWLVENNLEVAGIKAEIKISGRRKRLPNHIEVTLFRVISEALNNIIKHSQAKNAQINIRMNKNSARILIIDDGKGFDVGEAIGSNERPRGLGILGMKERVELKNGTLNINSNHTGTEIVIEIPLD